MLNIFFTHKYNAVVLFSYKDWLFVSLPNMLCGLNFVKRIITYFLCKLDSEGFCEEVWGDSNSYVYPTVCVKNFKIKWDYSSVFGQSRAKVKAPSITWSPSSLGPKALFSHKETVHVRADEALLKSNQDTWGLDAKGSWDLSRAE